MPDVPTLAIFISCDIILKTVHSRMYHIDCGTSSANLWAKSWPLSFPDVCHCALCVSSYYMGRKVRVNARPMRQRMMLGQVDQQTFYFVGTPCLGKPRHRFKISMKLISVQVIIALHVIVFGSRLNS